MLLGRDPGDIERIWADLYRAFDFQVAGGAEIRALSAIDLALWDLLGKHLGAPVYRLIGGKANPRIRLYNTCFPYKYDFNREPEKIMRELIETRGIKAIKIWPFDGAAARNRNQFITPRDIDEALQPVRKLRETFGSDIDIAVEGKTLTIRGERKVENVDNVNYHRRERRAGKFRKAITLPLEINAEAVGAECRDGVLRLTLPKAEKAKPRKITVNGDARGRIEAV